MRLPAPLIPLALAAVLAGCAPESDAAFGQRVRAYLLEHPEVLQEAIERLNATKAAAAETDAKKRLVSNTPALIADPRDPVIGDPKAPITVVEFFDYRCGYCKASAPAVLALTERHKDVRLVMKEMPILPDADGAIGVSARAARVALLAHKQGKYAPVHRALMAQRALDAAAVDRIARQHGVNLADVGSSDLTDHLIAVHQLAGALNIDGTPAFIIGDTLIAGADMPALDAAIEAQRRRG